MSTKDKSRRAKKTTGQFIKLSDWQKRELAKKARKADTTITAYILDCTVYANEGSGIG